MFNERLKEKRLEKGLTQIELANRVGITRDLYNKYERAGVRPSHETLVLLAKSLDTTIDYLLTGESNDTAPSNSLLEIDINSIEFALYGEVRELDDEDKAELLRDAMRMRELRELRRKQRENDPT